MTCRTNGGPMKSKLSNRTGFADLCAPGTGSSRGGVARERRGISLPGAQAVPQLVWAARPDGWNMYFNQQWMDYTGLTLEESYGYSWEALFHADDEQRAWEAWQQATEHHEPDQ